jgi:hypothetical protein
MWNIIEFTVVIIWDKKNFNEKVKILVMSLGTYLSPRVSLYHNISLQHFPQTVIAGLLPKLS